MSDRSSRSGLWWMLAGFGILAIVYVGWKVRFKVVAPDLVKAMEHNTRGVGLMDRFEYGDAAIEFEAVTRLAPDWLPGHVNLAISQLNQDKIEKIDLAIERFKFVLSRDPENLHAHYCLGFVLTYNKDFVTAIPHIEAVTRGDPTDAGGWYQLGYVLSQLQGIRPDEPGLEQRALECFEKAHQLNPAMIGPISNLVARLDDGERKDRMLALDAGLRAANVGMPNTLKYTEQGSRYARAIGRPDDAVPKPVASRLPVCEPWPAFTIKLADNAQWSSASTPIRERFGATMVTLDFNRDGRLDLFLPSAVEGESPARLLRNEGSGVFTDVTTAAKLVGIRDAVGASAADFDNDHFPDLLVTTTAGVRLYRNRGDGTFEDRSPQATLDQLSGAWLGAAWLDLEQDGDLDLVIGRDGNENIAVFLNVGEARPVPPGQMFGPLTTKFRRAPEIEKMLGRGATFAVADADGDVDVDVCLLPLHGVPALGTNDRLLRFRRADVAATANSETNGVVVLDVDQDERSDLLLLIANERPVLLMNRVLPGQEAGKGFDRGSVDSPPLKQARVVDFDLDGWPDIVGLSTIGRPVLLHNDRAGKLVHVPEALGADIDWPADLIAVTTFDLDGDDQPDVLAWSATKGLIARRSLGNGNSAVKVRLVGRRDSDRPPAERSNNDGIGARVIVQAGRQWTTTEIGTACAGLGQSSEPLILGIGRASSADAVVRVRWPDMTAQAEFLNAPHPEFLELAKENVWELRQENRKPISCPILITWDGVQWVYITDFLGAGSLGEMQPNGGTRPARPEESLRIEPSCLRPKDGAYVVRIAEPMDEVTYLDRLRLDVVDLPPGVDVYPDERFATSDPPATQERLYVRERFVPKARDQRGRDVAEVLRERDSKTTGGFDYRSWIGFAGEHWVELDFGDVLKSIGPKDRAFLVLSGWTNYPYPESIFAATQAGIEVVAPVLERERDGKWESVCDLGFPAGLPRVMTRDVTGLLAGSTGKLRIRTNMQIYWDQIFLARAVQVPEVRVAELGVASAKLEYRGMLRETRPHGSELIGYDPSKVVAAPVTRWKGFVTRTGDVTELLADTDDRVVILGPGDDMTVTFDATKLPPLPAGWTRQFVMRSWGWCKDASLFTVTGGEVGPLPFRAMRQYPPGANEVHPQTADAKTWHTRRPR